MKLRTFRLKPGQDIKSEIEQFTQTNKIKAGFIVTCVGGLQQATLRMAGATPDRQDIRTFEGHFEITSLVGTLSANGCHLHMTISDTDGNAFGGHLKEGSIVHPTAEIVIGEDLTMAYTRELDGDTGFTELVVRPR